MDQERYAAIRAEAHSRVAARNLITRVLEDDRQAMTIAPDELRAAGWFVGGVDELMEAIGTAREEPDRGDGARR